MRLLPVNTIVGWLESGSNGWNDKKATRDHIGTCCSLFGLVIVRVAPRKAKKILFPESATLLKRSKMVFVLT